MIELVDRRIRIDGQDRLVLAGEVHYFRLARADWADRLDALVEAGCNAVATYIPWLVHEDPSGAIDLTGTRSPENDLGAFIDLAAERGLWFVARPGPFVMAEMKNEGLPYRLYREHPEISPVGWDAVPAPTRTVDYLAPAFLAETDRWYAAVMPLLAAHPSVIAVQLDNEVGMLAWVTNSPDLTPLACTEFADWLRDRPERAARYPYLDLPDRDDRLRAAADGTGPALRHDLPLFTRDRFARYIAWLRDCARGHGMTGVPFLVNVHGTSEGRADSFPIGLSQLIASYRDVPDLLPGSDHYVGDLTPANASSVHMANAFLDASAGTQPTSCLEFEAGTGDYGQDRAHDTDPSAIDLKTRLCVAQGNRMINYYLFSGGVNRPLDEPVGDGDNRIAFTGQRHGFAAPVDPEGVRTRAFHALRRAVDGVAVLGDRLAGMHEEFDGVTLGFAVDHYGTEYVHPADTGGAQVAAALTEFRGGGPRGVLPRAMLLAGYRFGATLVPDALDPATMLAFAPTPHLDEPAQRRLVEFLRAGGRMLAFGALPVADLDGRECRVLVDALGLAPAGERRGSGHYFPTVRTSGWAAGRADARVGTAQLFTPRDPDSVFAVEQGSGLACGVDVGLGAGRVIALTCGYICDETLFAAALARLGAKPAITRTGDDPGLLITTTAGGGDRLLHLLNPTGHPAAVTLAEHGTPLLGGAAVEVAPRSGLILPLGLTVDGARIHHSTAELATLHPLRLRTAGTLTLDTQRAVTLTGGGELHRTGATHTVHAQPTTEIHLR